MSEAKLPPLNILVADDSSTVRRFIVQSIENAQIGANCVEVVDGNDCLKKLVARTFDIAFVDVNMPELSGMDAVAQSRDKGITTFVVIMSTEWSAERIELARLLNVYEFLTKPFEEADMVTIIDNYRRFNQPTSVLLVDDSAATRSVIKRIFEDSIFNLKVAEVADGPSALVAYKSGHHDIVFLDINMPGINGLDTLTMLRKLNEQVRFVLITSDRSEDLASSREAEMAQSLLYKPFFKADIDRVLHELFDLRAPTFGEHAEAEKDLTYL